jgi:hypothetical protein
VNRCDLFLYRGHGGYLRRALCASSRLARTALTFAFEVLLPPRAPIFARYFLTASSMKEAYWNPL